MGAELRAWRHYLRAIVALSILTACGQQTGCSGCDEQNAAAPFPNKDKVQSAVQVRLTRPGIEFLEQNLEPLLAQALPEEGLSFCLPGDGGDIIGLVQWGFCQDAVCPEGGNGCNINIGIEGVDLEAVPPDQIRASVTFDDLSTRIDIAASPIVDCALAIDGPGFTVGVPLTLSTPEPTRELTFALAGAPEYQLADLDIRLENEGGALGFLCSAIDGVINFPFIGDFILGAIQGLVDGLLLDQVNGLVEGFTCRTCMEDRECRVAEGAACVEGVCRNADNSCVQAPLGVEGALDLGSLLSGFSPGLEANIAYHAVPGSYVAVENGGISLGVIAGAVSDRNRCVPSRPQPPVFEPLRTNLLRGNIDLNENEYEVGIGVTQEILGHFMWAAFNSGVLCLQITTDTVEQLTAGTLGIALPNLGSLARNPQAPIGLTIQPQEVPNVVIGANTMMEDDEGNMVLDDPLLTINVPDLWIDFHVFMDDRWVRIFSLHTDVSLPLGVAFTPNNEIVPILGDIAEGIGNIYTENGEVMQDSPALIAGLLPVILNAFVGDLAGGLVEPIELPDIMGFRLDLQDGAITGIEENTMMGVFARLNRAPVEEENAGGRASVETSAEVLEVYVPPTEEFAIIDVDSWRKPYVKLQLDAWDATDDDPEMEFSWKVDNGTWTAFSPSHEVTVRHPLLLLQGKHTVLVRARRVDDYRTLDPTPTTLQVIIDSQAPALDVVAQGEGYRVETSDLVSGDAVQVEVRFDGGEWRPLPERFVSIAEADEAIDVRATDEAGNVSEASIGVTRSSLIGRIPPDQLGEDGGCGGCRVGARPSAPAGWLVFGAALLLGLGRRRLGKAQWLAVGAALAVLLVGCDDNANNANEDPPNADVGVTPECDDDRPCPTGQLCQDGVCVELTCADDPAICENLDCGNRGAICNDAGMCECLPFCPAGCGDGAYCCEVRNACEMPPEASCADAQCDDGFEVGLVGEGEVDPTTCERINVQCDCVEAEPLDPGFVGRFADMTVHDGVAWVSAYAEDYGDLVVGRYDVVAGFVWQWVDGVPDGEVVAGPSGPRGGVDDDGDDVGQYTSIAAAADGTLHIAYYDVDNEALKYAHGAPRPDGGHDWSLLTLDGEGDAGRWASIALGPDGAPGIAYRVGSVPDGEASVSQLRFIMANSPNPAAEADWGAPLVVQSRVLPNANPETGNYPEGTGLFTSQARDPEGRPVLAWYDRSEGKLWMSQMVDAGFAEPQMMAGWGHPDPDRDGDMGANVDLFIDGEGTAHLCYQDGMTDSLRYLAPSLEWDDWVDDGVWLDVGGRSYAVHVVGDDCNVRLDGDGNPLIVFQDATLQALLLRRRNREVADPALENPWSGRVVLRGDEAMFQGSFGFYAAAEVVDGELWVVHYVYNNQVRPASRRLEMVVEPL